jgi:hypothetical protein
VKFTREIGGGIEKLVVVAGKLAASDGSAEEFAELEREAEKAHPTDQANTFAKLISKWMGNPVKEMGCFSFGHLSGPPLQIHRTNLEKEDPDAGFDIIRWFETKPRQINALIRSTCSIPVRIQELGRLADPEGCEIFTAIFTSLLREFVKTWISRQNPAHRFLLLGEKKIDFPGLWPLTRYFDFQGILDNCSARNSPNLQSPNLQFFQFSQSPISQSSIIHSKLKVLV